MPLLKTLITTNSKCLFPVMAGVGEVLAPLVPDLLGGVRCKLLPPERKDEIISEGYGFDGSSCGFCSVNDSDLVALPDPSTETLVGRYRLFICDVYKAGERSSLDTRFALERAISRLKEHGLDMITGTEVEFYILKRGSSLGVLDSWRYMELVPDASSLPLSTDLMLMAHSKVRVQFTHHEVGPGQFELTLVKDTPRSLADRVILLKWMIRHWISERGLLATFMPKPFIDRPGSGMHIHFSLLRDGKSIMRPEGRSDGKAIFSEEAAAFLAGILEHARALCILTSPTVNSYKRLMPKFGAPIYVCWGIGNRSALARVPKHAAARDRLRIELRAPDPSCNPYLALAGIIIAGLRGLEEGLELPEPVNENVYELKEGELERLPADLEEAIEAAERDLIIREALGPELAEQYLKLKKAEWSSYLKALEQSGEDPASITSWELAEYLERP